MAKSRKHAPAKTPEDRENQLIALAEDLAEQKLVEGTASTPIIVHYLRLGTSKVMLEKEKLRKENDLLEAKTEAIQSAKNVERLYADAIEAMTRYRGSNSADEQE